MEIFFGMILFLQVSALIQNMLTRRRLLRQINQQGKNLEKLFEQIKIEKTEEKSGEMIKNQTYSQDYPLEGKQAEKLKEKTQNKKQEELINEVLSEIFS